MSAQLNASTLATKWTVLVQRLHKYEGGQDWGVTVFLWAERELLGWLSGQLMTKYELMSYRTMQKHECVKNNPSYANH